MFWRSVDQAASREAMLAPLPGYYNGPADAYRHIVGTAELRRRFGFGAAYTVATGNEMIGTHRDGHAPELRQMDDHNNAIGLAIGARARTFDDVVAEARAAIAQGLENRGSGEGDTPRWLPTGWGEPQRRSGIPNNDIGDWVNNVSLSTEYRYGAERFRFGRIGDASTPREREARLLERLAETPVEEWTETDVRGVIASTPYLNTSTPDHQAWRDRVAQYFADRLPDDQNDKEGDEAETQIESLMERPCRGSAEVRAHTRAGRNGLVQVEAHTRTVTCK